MFISKPHTITHHGNKFIICDTGARASGVCAFDGGFHGCPLLAGPDGGLVLHVGYHPDGLGQSDWSGIPGVFVGPTDGDFWVQRIDYPLLRAVPKAG